MGLALASDWLRKYREIFQPIITRSNANCANCCKKKSDHLELCSFENDLMGCPWVKCFHVVGINLIGAKKISSHIFLSDKI